MAVRACFAALLVASCGSRASGSENGTEIGAVLFISLRVYPQPSFCLSLTCYFYTSLAHDLLASGAICRAGTSLKAELEDPAYLGADENLKGTTKRDTRLESRTCLGLPFVSGALFVHPSSLFFFFFSFFTFCSTAAFDAAGSHWSVLAARP